MHKHQINGFSIVKSLFTLICITIFLTTLFFVDSVSAQSSEIIDFSMSLDKTAVSPGDTFTINYKITNNSTSYAVTNVKISLDYIKKLTNTTLSGSTTGLSADNLESNGYKIDNLQPQKTINLGFYFKLDSSAIVGQKIQNTLDNSTNATSTIEFKYSNDPSAVIFTKDALVSLPDITKPIPQALTVKYPTGITGTDLSKIDPNTANSVSGFFLKGVNQITYSEAIDLTTSDAANSLKNFSQTFDLNSVASITINNTTAFNKKAKVQMNNLTFVDTPQLYLGDKKYLKTITYDSKTKSASFDIDGNGVYTLIGEVKLNSDLPAQTQSKSITIAGKLTDPQAKLDIEIDAAKLPAVAVDITTGNFSFDYEFKSEGEKSIIFTTYAKNNVANKQPFSISYYIVAQTPTPVPSTIVPKDDKFYFSAFLYSVLAILVVGIIAGAGLIYFSLHKKKKNLKNSPVSNATLQPFEIDETPVDIFNIKKQSQKDLNLENLETSENRHEIIRAKIEEMNKENNLSDKDNDIPELPEK